jgi:outer membrane protein
VFPTEFSEVFLHMQLFRRSWIGFTLCVAVAVHADAPGTIAVTVDSVQSANSVVIEIYDDADAFGDLRRPLQRAPFTADELAAGVQLEGIPAGDYALMAFEDLNGNGVLDRNFLGIPKEPTAFSQGYAPKGPPVFDRARFAVTPGGLVEQRLRFDRVLGSKGQIGAGIGMIAQDSPYRGASGRVLQPIPALVYIGDRLQITGPRVSYAVLGSDRLRLAVQSSLRIGAYDESDSPLLVGLGDRDTTVLSGLALAADLGRGFTVSASYEHDILSRFSGGTGRIEIGRGWQLGAVRISPQVALNWLDTDLSAFEFGVPEAAARSDRPAWQPGSAWNPELGMSSFIELTPRWRVVGNFAVERLDSGIRNSPIVGSDYRWRGFVALTYTF